MLMCIRSINKRYHAQYERGLSLCYVDANTYSSMLSGLMVDSILTGEHVGAYLAKKKSSVSIV